MSFKSDFLIENGVLKKYRGNEKNVAIPFGVTTIGSTAFKKSAIESVIMPNSVTVIEDKAFHHCESLTEITIPYSVIEIKNEAFLGCDSLKAVHISDIASWCNVDFGPFFSNPLGYAHDLYLNGELVKELVVPDDVTIIKKYAFEGASFDFIVFPNNITTIDSFSFRDCEFLKSVDVPSSVKNIFDGIFCRCNSLSKVVIRGELDDVGSDIFFDCNNLKEIYVCSDNSRKLVRRSFIFDVNNSEIIVNPLLNKDSSNIVLGAEYLNTASTPLAENTEFSSNQCKIENYNNLTRF